MNWIETSFLLDVQTVTFSFENHPRELNRRKISFHEKICHKIPSLFVFGQTPNLSTVALRRSVRRSFGRIEPLRLQSTRAFQIHVIMQPKDSIKM
jgi:hypothetical protein